MRTKGRSARMRKRGSASARSRASTSVRNVLRATSLAAVIALVVVVGATAQRKAGSSGATATAWAVKVIIPGETGAGSHVATSPPDAVGFGGSFSYPTDGSIVKAASTTTSVSSAGGTQASAAAT